MNRNSVTVTLTLKIETHFSHSSDALAYNVSPYWVWLQMVQRCISSKLTLTETYNLGCDIDLEYSKATFSQDTPAYEHALSN